jgi:hypothetical protein
MRRICDHQRKNTLIAGKSIVTKVLRFPGFGFADGAVKSFDEAMAKGRTQSSKVTCEGCYFKCHGLCAVSEAGPCATFRPDRPEGLRPPQQMRFDFRSERRLQVAWAFPSPAEQVALRR